MATDSQMAPPGDGEGEVGGRKEEGGEERRRGGRRPQCSNQNEYPIQGGLGNIRLPASSASPTVLSGSSAQMRRGQDGPRRRCPRDPALARGPRRPGPAPTGVLRRRDARAGSSSGHRRRHQYSKKKKRHKHKLSEVRADFLALT